MTAIITRVAEIEKALERALAREQCTSDQGCSALANVLLAALVKCRKDPAYTAQVSHQMRRLASKIVDLSGADETTADRILRDALVR